MAELMLFLQEQYLLGMVAGSLIVVGVYLYISIWLLLRARKVGLDVGVSAMIPVYNLSIGVRSIIKKKKLSKKAKEFDEELEIEF